MRQNIESFSGKADYALIGSIVFILLLVLLPFLFLQMRTLSNANQVVSDGKADSRALIKQGTINESAHHVDLDNAINKNPNSIDNYLDRADLESRSLDNNEWRKAKNDFTKVIELEPTNERAYEGRAIVYARFKLDKLAIADYTKAIELDQQAFLQSKDPNPYLYSFRGALYLKHNQYANAVADYTTVIEHNGKEADYLNRAEAYQDLGDYAKALADYQKAYSFSPTAPNAKLHEKLADVYLKLRENEKPVLS